MRFNAEQYRKKFIRLLEQFEQASGAQKNDVFDTLHREICRLEPEQIDQVVASFNLHYDSFSFLDRRKALQTRATMFDYVGGSKGIQFAGRHRVYVPVSSIVADLESSRIEEFRRRLSKMLVVGA